MMGDPTSSLTRALGLELAHPGPQARQLEAGVKGETVSVHRAAVPQCRSAWVGGPGIAELCGMLGVACDAFLLTRSLTCLLAHLLTFGP